jgi:hypothetical protein
MLTNLALIMLISELMLNKGYKKITKSELITLFIK